MDHDMITVFAYQETLLIMAVFGLAILAMIWVGFRRWLQSKERMSRLIAEQATELGARYGAQIERVEDRLKAIEQVVTGGTALSRAQIDALPSDPLPEPIPNRDHVPGN